MKACVLCLVLYSLGKTRVWREYVQQDSEKIKQWFGVKLPFRCYIIVLWCVQSVSTSTFLENTGHKWWWLWLGSIITLLLYLLLLPSIVPSWRVILRFIAVLTQFRAQIYNAQMMVPFDANKEWPVNQNLRNARTIMAGDPLLHAPRHIIIFQILGNN